MNRRQFMRGVFAGIATVAIASKLAPEFPKFGTKSVRLAYTITSDEIDEGLYMQDVGHRYAAALGRSMLETKEMTGLNVLNRAFVA